MHTLHALTLIHPALLIVTLFLLLLANFRLTKLVLEDTLLEPLREKIWTRFPPESSRLGYLFTCPWCMSMWTGTLLIAAYIMIPVPTLIIAAVLTLSAVAGFLSSKT